MDLLAETQRLVLGLVLGEELEAPVRLVALEEVSEGRKHHDQFQMGQGYTPVDTYAVHGDLRMDLPLTSHFREAVLNLTGLLRPNGVAFRA